MVDCLDRTCSKYIPSRKMGLCINWRQFLKWDLFYNRTVLCGHLFVKSLKGGKTRGGAIHSCKKLKLKALMGIISLILKN